MKFRSVRLVLIFLLGLNLPAFAVQPDEMLKDPQLEARARQLSEGFRCLVCQNQSIDESDASLARDLRVLIRERLTKGDTDQQVTDFVVSRYGEYVLLKPRFGRDTWLLWLLPFGIVLAGFSYLLLLRRSHRPATDEKALSPQEQDELKKLH